MKSITLSKRLTAVTSLVPESGCVADIGCDHGFVSVYLMQNRKAKRIIAMDVNEGPLSRAKEHIAEYGMESYIETRLSDGLNKISEKDGVQVAILAGMGGKLMEKILSEAFGRNLFVPTLVLQPQSDLEAFRAFLRKNDYTITEEKMIFEDGKYYPMMKACHKAPRVDGAYYESCIADAFGPLLLKEKDPVLKQFILRETHKFETIQKEMERNQSRDEKIAQRLSFLAEAEKFFAKGDTDAL